MPTIFCCCVGVDDDDGTEQESKRFVIGTSRRRMGRGVWSFPQHFHRPTFFWHSGTLLTPLIDDAQPLIHFRRPSRRLLKLLLFASLAVLDILNLVVSFLSFVPSQTLLRQYFKSF